MRPNPRAFPASQRSTKLGSSGKTFCDTVASGRSQRVGNRPDRPALRQQSARCATALMAPATAAGRGGPRKDFKRANTAMLQHAGKPDARFWAHRVLREKPPGTRPDQTSVKTTSRMGPAWEGRRAPARIWTHHSNATEPCRPLPFLRDSINHEAVQSHRSSGMHHRCPRISSDANASSQRRAIP